MAHHFWYALPILALGLHSPARASTPKIDGVIEEHEWGGSKIISLQYETSPGLNISPRETTEARLKVKDGKIFVAFAATDKRPEFIRSRRRERDSIFDEDSVGFIVAPNGKNASDAFFFYVSAGGTQFDSRWSEATESEDKSWDARWSSVARLVDTGYVVEIAIPLQSLPLPAGGFQTWAVDFVRVSPRAYRYRFASVANDRNRGCYTCQLGLFDVNVEQRFDWKALEVRADLLYQNGQSILNNESLAENTRNVGVEVSWKPSYNINASISLNPDFSQIESDALRPITNAADAFFFDERRPFFVEAAQYFRQPLPLLYTRNIADPDAAFSTRYLHQDGTTAVLFAQDNVTQFIEPGVEGSRLTEYRDANGYVVPSQALAIRTQHSLGSVSLGATATGRRADGYGNDVLAFDLRAPLSKSIMLNTAIAISTTDLPNGRDDGIGTATYVQFTGDTTRWTSKLIYDRYSDAFRSDLGNLLRNGVQRLQGSVRRTFRFDGDRAISDVALQIDSFRREEIGRGLVDRRTQLSASANAAFRTSATLWKIDGLTRYKNRYWDRSGWELAFETAPLEAWQGSIGLLSIGDVDRVGTRAAQTQQARLSIGWDPKDSIRWLYQVGHREVGIHGGRLFKEQIHDLRGYYYFSNDLYLRATVRSFSLDRNLGNYIGFELPARERSRDWQILGAWRPTVGTALYLGLNHGRDMDQTISGDDEDFSFEQKFWFFKVNISFDRHGLLR